MMTKSLFARTSLRRVLLGPLTLLAALSWGCRDNSPPPPTVAPAKLLNLYVVSSGPANGLRPVSLPPGGTAGYIASKPDFVLNRLVAVMPTISQNVTATANGFPQQPVSNVQRENLVLLLTIHDADLPALSAFLSKTEGQRVLFMIGDKPISAPQTIQTFTDKNFQILPDASVDPQQLEKDLKELVR